MTNLSITQSDLNLPVQPTAFCQITDCLPTGKEHRNALSRIAAGVMRETGLPMISWVDEDYPFGGAGPHFTDLIAANAPRGLRKPKGNTLYTRNSAPRALTAESKQNGRGLCWTIAAGHTLFIGTYDPLFFNDAIRQGLITYINIIDSEEVLRWSREYSLLSEDQAEEMLIDPFRGANLIPLIIGLILEFGEQVPIDECLTDLPFTPVSGVVERTDTSVFGPNVYIDVLYLNLVVVNGHTSLVNGTKVRIFRALRDIPAGQLGVVPASSGYGSVGQKTMLAVQGGSALKELEFLLGCKVSIGTPILLLSN